MCTCINKGDALECYQYEKNNNLAIICICERFACGTWFHCVCIVSNGNLLGPNLKKMKLL